MHVSLVHAGPYPSIPCADANARMSLNREVLSSAPCGCVCVGEVARLFTSQQRDTRLSTSSAPIVEMGQILIGNNLR